MELEKIRKLYEKVDPSQLTEREKLLTELIFTDRKLKTDKLPNGRYRILQFSGNNFEELENTLKLLLPDFVKSIGEEKIVIEAENQEKMEFDRSDLALVRLAFDF